MPKSLRSEGVGKNFILILRLESVYYGLLMDIRHPLKPEDMMIITWANKAMMPLHLVLTKADKLSRQQQLKSLSIVKSKLKQEALDEKISRQVFSSEKKIGLEELKNILNGFYELE